MLNVYLCRHGECVDNVHERVPEILSPLTESGIKKAQTLAYFCKENNIDAVFSGNSKRAIATAEILIEKSEINFSVNELFNQRRFPSDVLGKQLNNSSVQEVFRDLKENENDIYWYYSDEENTHEFFERVTQALNWLSKSNFSNVLVVTHAEVIKMVYHQIISQEKFSLSAINDLNEQFSVPNMAIMHAVFNGTWNIVTPQAEYLMPRTQ